MLRWPVTPPQFPAHAARNLSHDQLAASFARLPLQFEVNRGQADSQAKFLARGPGYALLLTSNEAVLSLSGNKKSEFRSQKSEEGRKRRLAGLARGKIEVHAPMPDREESTLIRMKLAGANPAAAPEGIDPLPGKTNYLVGNDPAEWRTGVETFSKVKYRDVYAGIDLIYYGNPQQLEYDFIVAPGASPSEIEMEFSGAGRVQLDAAGDLIVSLSNQAGANRPVRFRQPVVYQESDGRRREIEGRYALREERRVGFELAAYDPHLPLVIDPVLTYSTYLGKSGWDEIHAIAVDGSGNVYATGFTTSPDFPLVAPFRATKAAARDVFISKLSPDGTKLIYSTYLGGNDTDDGRGLAVDSSGKVTVAGYTYSTDFPVASAFQTTRSGTNTADGFVARLNESGAALVYSTYLGGTGDDAIWGLGLDGDGNAYVAGETTSSIFPTTLNAFQRTRASTRDSFVTKVSPTGNTLVYSTYLGGNSDDSAQGIAVGGDGTAYVTGYTLSTNFQIVNGFQRNYAGGFCVDQGFLVPCYDAFVARVSSNGAALTYSTYLGGDGDDIANGIALDSLGNAYITGTTISTNFPVAKALQATFGGVQDGFLTKLSANGASLVYSTYLGGQVYDSADAVAVNSAGEAFIVGATESNDFPVLLSLQPLNGYNAFVLKMNAAGNALQYSTFLGGTGFAGIGGDEAFAVATDSSGNAYVGGVTISIDFPAVNALQGAFTQTGCISGNLIIACPEGFLTKLKSQAALYPGRVVNAASLAPNAPVAAGSIVAAFGTELTTLFAAADVVPLPTVLANITVRMNGILAPLYFISGGQINLQVPWELAGQTQATVQVNSGSIVVPPINVNLATTAPGIFTVNSSGAGQGAIVISNSGVLAAPAGSISGASTRPARRGEVVTIYCTGLGPVDNRPETGAASPGVPNLATITTPPVVTIGGIQAAADFAGLSAGFVGFYQVDVAVPANAPLGSAVSVVVSVGGVASNTVQMAIQQ
ncbi:MAG: SBBP repeat-containing protein [Acidobacteria bacterium]|nr:SBBP repeat-containing protein [Acidobacteriota bacterium]